MKDQLLLIIVTSIFGIISTIISSVIIWAIKKQSDMYRELIAHIDALKKEINDFRVQVIQDFATKDEVDKSREVNQSSHVEIWKEVRDIQKEVARIDERLKKDR